MTPAADYHLLNSSLLIAVLLFALGAAGLAARRNVIVMFFSAALMLQGVSLSLCAFSSFHGDWTGHAAGLILLVLTAIAGLLAAAVAADLFERRATLDISQQGLVETDAPPPAEREPSKSDVPAEPTASISGAIDE